MHVARESTNTGSTQDNLAIVGYNQQRGLVIYSPSSFLDLNMLPLLTRELFPLPDTPFLSTGGLFPLLDCALAGEAFSMAGGL